MVLIVFMLSFVAVPASAQFEDQHDVKFIVAALQSPIPSNVVIQARAIDDQIMSKGEVQGQKVYLVTDNRAQGLNTLVRRLLSAMGHDEREWVVRVLDTRPPTINAFVFGGKYIYVYTGLLKEATSVDELAVVLGHELGHSLLKHNLRSQQDTTNTLAGVADIIGALAGGKKGYEQVSGVTKALRASYSRTDEEEADALGVAIAWRAGYDPLRGADFFSRMARRANDEQEKVKQLFAQRRNTTEQALASCQQWAAAAKANPFKRNQAQSVCNNAEQNRLAFNQMVTQYQSGLWKQEIYADHPSDQNRISAIAALTDYVNGRRPVESLQRFQQSYHVILALNQTGSVLTRRPDSNLGKQPEESHEARGTPSEAPQSPSNEGRTIFNGKKGACFACHGIDGDGSRGLNDRVGQLKPQPSNLRDANSLRFKTDNEIFWIIKNGIKGTAMGPARDRLTEQEIWQVVSYLHELRGESGVTKQEVSAPKPGMDQPQHSDKPMAEQLKQLKDAYEQGLLTEEEYQSKRKRVMERF